MNLIRSLFSALGYMDVKQSIEEMMSIISLNFEHMKSLTGRACLATWSKVDQDMKLCQERPAIVDLVPDPLKINLFNGRGVWYGSVSGRADNMGEVAASLWTALPEVSPKSFGALVLTGLPEQLTLPAIRQVCSAMRELLDERSFEFGVAERLEGGEELRVSLLLV